MFLKKIKTEGIAHLSYIIGSQDSAAVIDPRRDIYIYLSIAAKYSVNITHIFETHRNEDYVIGSVPLSQATGADIYHGGKLDFKYGNSVKEGDYFEIGELSLKIFETPGHTFESISIALYDPNFGNKAVGVFTGDALFIGDVGRTDFFPTEPKRLQDCFTTAYSTRYYRLVTRQSYTPHMGQALYAAQEWPRVNSQRLGMRKCSTLYCRKPVWQNS
ncbi:MAG: MBL fold metallo-hydrolase [Sedimentisphaeraceae bacterium JB056]